MLSKAYRKGGVCVCVYVCVWVSVRSSMCVLDWAWITKGQEHQMRHKICCPEKTSTSSFTSTRPMCVHVRVCDCVHVSVCVCARFCACDIRQHIIWVILGQTKIRLEPCSRFPDPLIELNYTWALSPLTRPPSHMRALGQFTKLKENYVLGTSSSLFWNLESQIDKMGIAGVGKIKWIREGISILHHLSDIPLGMLMVP